MSGFFSYQKLTRNDYQEQIRSVLSWCLPNFDKTEIYTTIIQKYDSPLAYSHAAKQCQSDGAFLPTTLDSNINSELVALGRQTGNIWLGLYCIHNGSTNSCHYQDGIALNSTGFTNFDGSLNLVKGSCVGLFTSGTKTGKWHSHPCEEEKLPFFCQYAAIRPQPGYCNAGTTLTAPITISSPGWPQNYPTDISCQYRVTGPTGSKLKVSFQQFSLDSSSAVTLFKDGSFSANVNLWSGVQDSFQQTVTGNVALLAFDSAESTGQGFTASITVA